MGDEEAEPALKDFRSRWTKAVRGGSDGNSEHGASGYSPSLNLELVTPVESIDGEFSDVFRNNIPQQSSHFIFQVAGAATVINSRRIIGLADIQLSMKASTRQARPLSVAEVAKLHQIASSAILH